MMQQNYVHFFGTQADYSNENDSLTLRLNAMAISDCDSKCEVS